MKRFFLFLSLILVLYGCSDGQEEMNQAIALRQKLLAANQCSFVADITADYGDRLCTFSMECTADAQGNLQFTVTAPEALSGISGTLRQEEGNLLFEDTALAFPLLADEQLSPVSSPWVFFKTLRSGYLKNVGREGELVRITIDDSYQEDALQLDIWTNEAYVPVRAEILHSGNRILSLIVKDFQIM